MLRPSLVLLGTAVALIGGGGVLAFAGWTSRSTSATFTITAAKIPQVARPTATRVIVPIITWKGVRIAPDNTVDRYVVTRHLGKATRVVCAQPASMPTRCVDVTAPPGSPFTYTVHATDGDNWVGAASEPSDPVDGSPRALDPSGTPSASASAASATPTVAAPTTDPVDPMIATDSSQPKPTEPVEPEPTEDPVATEEPAPVPTEAASVLPTP